MTLPSALYLNSLDLGMSPCPGQAYGVFETKSLHW